jgi:hypothetical protein
MFSVTYLNDVGSVHEIIGHDVKRAALPFVGYNMAEDLRAVSLMSLKGAPNRD